MSELGDSNLVLKEEATAGASGESTAEGLSPAPDNPPEEGLMAEVSDQLESAETGFGAADGDADNVVEEGPADNQRLADEAERGEAAAESAGSANNSEGDLLDRVSEGASPYKPSDQVKDPYGTVYDGRAGRSRVEASLGRSIDASIGESESFKEVLRLDAGNLGLEAPGKVSEGRREDFITAEPDADGRYRLVFNDAKVITTDGASPPTEAPYITASRLQQMNAAVDRAEFGGEASVAADRRQAVLDARAEGRVEHRYVYRDIRPDGGGKITVGDTTPVPQAAERLASPANAARPRVEGDTPTGAKKLVPGEWEPFEPPKNREPNDRDQ